MSTLPTFISRSLLLAGLALFLSGLFLAPTPVAAQAIDRSTPISLEGFAWSGYTDSFGNKVGVGWIDMSGVEMQAGGMLGGYAWSDNIGWIKFGGLSGFPNGGGSQAQNGELLPNGQMRGWARACAATVGGDCSSMTTDPNAGGWDGWISLRGNGGGSNGYGVRFSTTQQPDGSYEVETGGLPGDRYAWGGVTVMGWIDFSQVTLGGTPVTVGTDFITAANCVIPAGASTCDTTIQWDASSYGNPRVTIDQGVGDIFGTPPPSNGNNTYPLSGANSTYTVTLREGGTVIDSDTVTVSCAVGTDWDTGSNSCQVPDPDKPDLTLLDPIGNSTLDANTGSYNDVTGEYSNVNFLFRLRNQGATTTEYEGVTTVEWDLDYTEAVWPTSDSLSGSVPAIVDGNSRQVTADAGTLQFGIYEFTVVADPDDRIDEEVEGNNTETATVTFPPQDPSMVLTTVDSQIVRSGDTAEIRWDTVAEYPMTCTVSGPGIATVTFNPSTHGPTGSVTTSPRFNTSIYSMTCDVNYLGITATFSASTRVEVIPRLEEI